MIYKRSSKDKFKIFKEDVRLFIRRAIKFEYLKFIIKIIKRIL